MDEALAAITARVAQVPPVVYAAHMEEARKRVLRDPRDAPTVALALSLDCGIWTGDQDLFGRGVPVCTTESPRRLLEVGDIALFPPNNFSFGAPADLHDMQSFLPLLGSPTRTVSASVGSALGSSKPLANTKGELVPTR
ncbi:MAG: hypothetical protein HYX94_03005 [Chloroflexi bacterium]|nr:hypothetical protein [Chloroflexota bacterium]